MDNNYNNNITTNQKIAVAFLLFFTFVVVFLWSIQFRSNLMPTREPVLNTQDQAVSPVTKENKDTDGDGLLDIDELNIYKTSPYLEDSDSDGFSDAEEVNSNNDPNCPIGRICATALIKNDLDSEFLKDMQEAEDIVNSIVEDRQEKTDLSGILSGKSDAETLRASLISAGVDHKMLEQISDEDLLKAYKDILDEK